MLLEKAAAAKELIVEVEKDVMTASNSDSTSNVHLHPEEPAKTKIPLGFPKEFLEFKDKLRSKILIEVDPKTVPLKLFIHYIPEFKGDDVKLQLIGDNPEFLSFDIIGNALIFKNLDKESYG